jgi:hypothetical protein
MRTFPLSAAHTHTHTANIYHETSPFVTKRAFGRSRKDQGNVKRPGSDKKVAFLMRSTDNNSNIIAHLRNFEY